MAVLVCVWAILQLSNTGVLFRGSVFHYIIGDGVSSSSGRPLVLWRSSSRCRGRRVERANRDMGVTGCRCQRKSTENPSESSRHFSRWYTHMYTKSSTEIYMNFHFWTSNIISFIYSMGHSIMLIGLMRYTMTSSTISRGCGISMIQTSMVFE